MAGHRLLWFLITQRKKVPQALLFMQDSFIESLKREGLSFYRTILGEKIAFGPGYGYVLGTLSLFLTSVLK